MNKYGLVGKRLGHSISPLIHKQLFGMREVKADYLLYEYESVEEFLSCCSSLAGYNVTIPYKEQVFSMTYVDKDSRCYHSVNCVDNIKGISYNTDVFGFTESVNKIYPLNSGRILLLGFGGVAKMIATVYYSADLTIAIRNVNQAKIDSIKSLVGDNIKVVEIEDLDGEEYDLIVNATPIGMYPNVGECVISEGVVARAKAVYDTIYNPLQTQLLKYAVKYNIPNMNGLEMLVLQAVKSHEYWYGAKFSKDEIEQVIKLCEQELRS